MRTKWFIAAVLVIGFSLPAAARETITIVADQWCPYNCGQKDAKPGYMVDIVRQAFKKSDIDVVYKVIPWAQAIELTRQGKYDAIIGANHGDAPDFIFPDIVQGISVNQAWVKKDSRWTYTGLASLEGLRVGIVAGYSYGKSIDPYFKKRMGEYPQHMIVFSTDNAADLNIEALVAGRIDVILEDKNVVSYYFASRDQPMAIKSVGNPVDVDQIDDTYLFIAFGPNGPKSHYYADLLTRGMKEMRQSGELKAILASYDMDDLYRFLGQPEESREPRGE